MCRVWLLLLHYWNKWWKPSNGNARDSREKADCDGTATDSVGGDESIGSGDDHLNRWIDRRSSAGSSGTDCPSILLSHGQTAIWSISESRLRFRLAGKEEESAATAGKRPAQLVSDSRQDRQGLPADELSNGTDQSWLSTIWNKDTFGSAVSARPRYSTPTSSRCCSEHC